MHEELRQITVILTYLVSSSDNIINRMQEFSSLSQTTFNYHLLHLQCKRAHNYFCVLSVSKTLNRNFVINFTTLVLKIDSSQVQQRIYILPEYIFLDINM